ncbi:hypothetical protein [Marivirga sp.]|uniref:hypothetical protein n=1 Tax=Marivirga sp. TaxID=2018662 RepID=UPI002D7F0C93|nr:hypothetical protein [Marivirga sp.]HET8860006.1 hypothetical protein [Marivirga sp.]
MKKITIIYLALIPLIFTTLKAQTVSQNIIIGDEIKQSFKNGFYDLEILTDDEEYFYALEIPFTAVYSMSIGGSKKYAIAKYNLENLQPVKSVPLELTFEGKDRKYEFIAVVGGEIYLFTSFQNQEQKKTYLFVENIDKNTLEASKSLRKIAELDYSEYNRYKFAQFEHSISEDESKIMIRYNLLDKGNSIINGGFKVFDSNLKELLKYEEPLPLKEDAIFTFSGYEVLNNGEVIILGKYFDDKRSLKNSTKMKKKYFLFGPRVSRRYPNYHYQAYHINSRNQLLGYSFDDFEHYITDLIIGSSPSNEIIAAGLYSDIGKMNVKGTFTCELDTEDNKMTNIQFNDLDFNYLTKGLSERESSKLNKLYQSKKEFSTNFFALEDLVFYEDGSYALLAEPFYSDYVVRGNQQTGFYTVYRYQFKNIWVLKHDKSGELEWKNKVIKRQYVEDGAIKYASYGVNSFDDNIQFMYNVTQPGIFTKYGNPKKASLHQTIINENGELSTKMILQDQRETLPFYNSDLKELKSGGVLIFSNKGRNYKFLRVKN